MRGGERPKGYEPPLSQPPSLADAPGYVHVGLLASFLWQTDGDWANHSLADIYLNVVQNHPQVVKLGPRKYPQ